MDFPAQPFTIPNECSFTTLSPNCLTGTLMLLTGSAFASQTWQAANAIVFIPVWIEAPMVVRRMAIMNGATVSGNFDIGIYDHAYNCVVTKGSTAQSTINTTQSVDMTSSISGGTASPRLNPGTYFMALAFDNATATVYGWKPTIGTVSIVGALQQLSTFPLPTTSATPVKNTSATYPDILVTSQTVV